MKQKGMSVLKICFVFLCILFCVGMTAYGQAQWEQQNGVLHIQTQNSTTPDEKVKGVIFRCRIVGEIADWENETVHYRITDSDFAHLLDINNSGSSAYRMDELTERMMKIDAETITDIEDSVTDVVLKETDEQGETSGSLPLGLYLVICDRFPEDYVPSRPFLISIPSAYEWNNGSPVWVYDILSAPKLEKIPDITEDKFGQVELRKTFQEKPAENPELYESVTFRLEDDTGKTVSVFSHGNGRYEVLENETGEETEELVVGNDGLLIVKHLKYGKYSFIELTTGESYELLSEPVSFEIEDETCSLTVDNTKTTGLPSTGGSGTWKFIASGVLLMSVGAFLILRENQKSRKSRRKRAEKDE